MTAFRPRTTTLRGTVSVDVEPQQAFPLFSPEGERLWVPGWDPELLYPPGAVWAEGQIFRTREARGEAVWVVTRLDRARHRAEYHRVEPGRYVAHIEVACAVGQEGRTEASVTYTFVGLSDEGNREIAAMTQADHDLKMAAWQRLLEGRAR